MSDRAAHAEELSWEAEGVGSFGGHEGEAAGDEQWETSLNDLAEQAGRGGEDQDDGAHDVLVAAEGEVSDYTTALQDQAATPNAPSVELRQGVEPRVVGYFASEDLLVGFLKAFASACRTGVPANLLEGYTSHSAASGTAVTSGKDRRLLLEEEVRQQKQRAARAHEQVLSAGDKESADAYAKDEQAARKRARAAQAELDELSKPTEARAPAPSFATQADMLHHALLELASCGGRVSQARHQALKTVMPKFAMRRDDSGQWWAAAVLRLNVTGGGVAELGPIEWSVGGGGRGSGIRRLDEARTVDTSSRDKRLKQLLATGQITRAAALLLLSAPFPELPYVFLQGAAGVPYPDWVDEPWRSEPYVRWLTSTYSGLERPRKHYVVYSHLRQLLAYLCAAEGRVTFDRFQALVPLENEQRLRTASEAKSQGRDQASLEPSVVRVGPKEAALRAQQGVQGPPFPFYESVLCGCGQPARVVARLYEVPRGLLCECGRMPDAERFGMDADVLFPPAYARELMLPKNACEAELRRQMTEPPKPLTPLQQRVLSHLQRNGGPHTKYAVARAVSSSHHHVEDTVTLLTSRHLAARTRTGGSFVWQAVMP